MSVAGVIVGVSMRFLVIRGSSVVVFHPVVFRSEMRVYIGLLLLVGVVFVLVVAVSLEEWAQRQPAGVARFCVSNVG
jgi:hypothetical protein